MKTKNLLTRISASALFAAAALLPAALTSCSSDSEPAPTPDPIPEGMAMLNLAFGTPDMGIETRAGDINTTNNTIAADATEAKINSLWLYIFKIEENNGTKTSSLAYAFDCFHRIQYPTTTPETQDVTDWRPVNLGAESGSSYAEGLPIVPGTYHFYMVANLGDYLSTADKTKYEPAESGVVTDALKSVTEANIKDLALSLYDADNNTITLANGNLPMGMNYTEVATGQTSSPTAVGSGNTLGDVVITTGSTTILCDMTFLCSAVRYTFLYDKSSFSWNYSKLDIASEGVKLNNIQSGYKFTENLSLTATTTTKAQNVTLTASKFAASASFENSPVTLSTAAANDATSYAYQGIAYLPSNYATAEADKTFITLACDLGDKVSKTYTIPLPNKTTTDANANRLAKGNFYDVIGKVSASGMEFYVTVRKWQNGGRQTIKF